MRNLSIISATIIFFCFLISAEARSKKKGVDPVPLTTDDFWKFDLEEDKSAEIFTVGMVSWYGPGFHRRKTASGERYDMHDFTCASRELPFGTMLEVTNPKNGKKAMVRVNDRGPQRKSRILDLSYAAAQKLGFVKSGIAKVEIRKLEEGPSPLFPLPRGEGNSVTRRD